MTFKDWSCFQHMEWQPDSAELRKFSVSMLVGFAVIGLLAALRHHAFGHSTFVLWTVGAVLAVGAQLPGLGRGFYLLVYVPTSMIGYVVSRMLLSVIFSVVFVPLALLLRASGKNLLELKRPAATTLWQPCPETDPDRIYSQF